MPAIITGRFQSGDGYDGIAVTNFYNEIYPVATSGWRIRDKLKFLGYSTSSYYVNSKFLTVGAVNYGTDGGVYCDIAGSNLNGINIYGGSNLNFYAWFELKSSLVPVSSTGGYYDIDVQTGSYSKSVGWELSSNVLTYYQSNQMKIIIKAVAYSNYRFIRWVYANRNMKDNTDNCWIKALFAPYSSTTYTFKSSSNGRVTFSYRKIEYGVGVGKYKNGIDSSTSSVKWTYSYTTENGISIILAVIWLLPRILMMMMLMMNGIIWFTHVITRAFLLRCFQPLKTMCFLVTIQVELSIIEPVYLLSDLLLM